MQKLNWILIEIKKKKLFLIFLLIGCAVYESKLPPNIFTSLNYNIRSLASGDGEAFLALSKTSHKIEHIENILTPLVSLDGKGVSFSKEASPITVSDFYKNGKLDLDSNKLNLHNLRLRELIKKMFIIKYEILWLSVDFVKRNKYEGFQTKEDSRKEREEIKNSYLVKLHTNYFKQLGALYYYYTLIAHLNEELNKGSLFKFDYKVLEGLDLVTHELVGKQFKNTDGLNINRLTLPVYKNNESLKANDAQLETIFGKDGFKLLKNHYSSFKRYYVSFGGDNTLSEQIDGKGVCTDKSDICGEYIDQNILLSNHYYFSDLLQFGVSNTTKLMMEYLVLKKPVSKIQFAKLNQFLAIREGLLNSWGIARLTKEPQDLACEKCGNGFLNFRSDKKTLNTSSYVKNIWKSDFYVNQFQAATEKARNLINGQYIGQELKANTKEENKLSALETYHLFLEDLVINLNDDMPEKLQEILSNPQYKEIRSAENPRIALAANFSSDLLFHEIDKFTKYDQMSHQIKVYGDENLSLDYLVNILSLKYFSDQKKAFLKTLLDRFVYSLDFVEKYDEDFFDGEITQKDFRKVRRFLSEKIDGFAVPWQRHQRERLRSELKGFFKNKFKNNYNQKLDTLYAFLNSENITNSLNIIEYFKNHEEDLAKNKWPLPFTTPSLPQEFLIRDLQFEKDYPSRMIGSSLIKGKNTRGSKILKELNEELLKISSNDAYLAEGISKSYEGYDDFKVSEHYWNALKSAFLKLRKKYPFSKEKFEKRLYKSKQEIIFADRAIPQEILELEKVLEECKSYEECKPTYEVEKVESPTTIESFFEKMNKESDGFALYYFASKFNFLSFSENAPNPFHESSHHKKIVASLYIDNMIKLEPFFKSRFERTKTVSKTYRSSDPMDIKTGRGRATYQSKEKYELGFFDLIAQTIAKTQKPIEKNKLKEILDEVIVSSKLEERSEFNQDFCLADFYNFERDPHFKSIYYKTKHIREMIVSSNQSMSEASKYMDKKIDSFRYWMRYWGMRIGFAFIGILILSGFGTAVGWAGLGSLMGTLMHPVIFGVTSVFFLSLTIYELSYPTFLEPQLDIQRALVASQNLRNTKNLKFEEIINIDTFERIDKEYKEAISDMKFAAVFAIMDISAFKYLFKSIRLRLKIPQYQHLKKVSSDPDLLRFIKVEEAKRAQMSKMARFTDDLKSVLRLSPQAKIPVNPNRLSELTFDSVKYAIKNSKIDYKNFSRFNHLSQEQKNMVHYLLEVTQEIDAKLVKDMNNYIRFGRDGAGRLKSIVKDGKRFNEFLKTQKLDDIDKVFIEELAKTLNKVESIKVKAKDIKGFSNKDGTYKSFSDDYIEVIRKYYDQLEVFAEGKDAISEAALKVLSKSKIEQLEKLRDFKKSQFAIIDRITSGKFKSSDEAFSFWREELRKYGKSTEDIVEKLTLRRNAGEFIFEMAFESRWKSLLKAFRQTPDTFLGSIYDDLTHVRDIQETLKSSLVVKNKNLLTRLTQKVIERIQFKKIGAFN